MAIRPFFSHMAILPYGQMAKNDGQYGCLLNQLYKYSNLAKELNWFDLFCRNGSKISLMAFFPLYFSENPLYMQKRVAKPQNGQENSETFFGGLLYVYTAMANSFSTLSSYWIFQDTLMHMSNPLEGWSQAFAQTGPNFPNRSSFSQSGPPSVLNSVKTDFLWYQPKAYIGWSECHCW